MSEKMDNLANKQGSPNLVQTQWPNLP